MHPSITLLKSILTEFSMLYDYFLFLYADITSAADYILVVEKESGQSYSDKSWSLFKEAQY